MIRSPSHESAVRMPRVRHVLATGLIMATAIGAIGCDSDFMPVQGIVRREGRIVPAGRVIFSPIGEGTRAIGAIQADGSFQLTSERPNDGARVGQYRVTVAGERGAANADSRTTFVAPPSFAVEVVADKANMFEIDIRRESGWQVVTDD